MLSASLVDSPSGRDWKYACRTVGDHQQSIDAEKSREPFALKPAGNMPVLCILSIAP
jgi:hypothetical protein